MKNRILGLSIMIVSVAGGIYIGGWRFLIKPIMDILEAIDTRFMVWKILWAVFKIACFSWSSVTIAICQFCYGWSTFKNASSEL